MHGPSAHLHKIKTDVFLAFRAGANGAVAGPEGRDANFLAGLGRMSPLPVPGHRVYDYARPANCSRFRRRLLYSPLHAGLSRRTDS